ncbi:tyrosine-protein phosphatase Lar-like isoform X1, partial [Vespula maculifrons]
MEREGRGGTAGGMWNGDGNHAVLTKDGVAFIHLAAAVSLFVDPPTILVRPQSQQVKAGGIASFFCTAQGAPPPQIHWRKNGKRIS